MITYNKTTLDNGLTVIAHRDPTSQMAAVNMLYRVGARDEDPSRTGFAHLFEHLMFRGTVNVPDFDIPVQMACGENNAFTNNDYTDFYIVLPKDNIETALWLESDRMTGLNITPEALATEKKVVIEEFNQRYLNQPYGRQWLVMRDLAYKVHPYRWAAIGITPQHIADASLEDVRGFYERFYQPDNAILSVAADIDPQEVFALAEKWFGGIPAHGVVKAALPEEPRQTEARRAEVREDVPANAVTIAFHMGGRHSDDFYQCDVMSDILAGGTSARLYQRLVKDSNLFSGVNAYITGDVDPGLFILTGHLHEGVTTAQGEEAMWHELESLKSEPAGEYELEKVKNKFEANTVFGELNVMNKALNLSFYEMLGDISLINGEVAKYRTVTAQQVMETARRIFTTENSSTLLYIKDNG